MTKTNTIALKLPLAKRNFNTPQILKGALYCTWGASLLLVIATITGVRSQRHAIQVVGRDAVPSILNAQRIKDSLADMGANVVNEMLVKPGANPDATAAINERRQKLGKLLVKAADNITYGERESQPIETMINGLTQYMLVLQQARDANARGDRKTLMAAYNQLVEINQNQIQPAADALNKVNYDELQNIYNQERTLVAASLSLTVLSGLLLLIVLISTQLFLYRRMRRIINPMLLTATVITTIFLSYTIGALLSSSHYLKVAKEDSFISLYALRQARALAYSANRDESRYLLDIENANQHEAAFFEKVNQIAKPPSGMSLETALSLLTQGQKVPGFKGFLADQLQNITFPGEREATVKTIATFREYLRIDQQIRALKRSGKLQEAIALCTGNQPGESNWAFEQFKTAQQEVIDINDKAFNTAVTNGFKSVDNFEVTTPVTMALVSLLALLGLRPRLREYDI